MNEIENMNRSFNRQIVDSLDVLNKVLAGIFIVIAIGTFITTVLEGQLIGAILSTMMVIGVGIVTCGYTALLLNINNNIQSVRDKIDSTQ
jgi:hypothetical protein